MFAGEVEKNPGLTASWVGWGTAQARLGKCEEALEKFWPFAYTRPFKVESALLAARCSSRLGYLDDAVYFDSLAVLSQPTNVPARSALALDLDRAGDVVGREIVLEQLSLIDPNKDASLFASAAIAVRHGDIEAFDVLDHLWQREGRADEEFLRLRAVSWLDIDDPHQAYAEMTVVRAVRRGNGARLLIVESLRRMGLAEDALDRFDRSAVSKLQGMDAEVIRARVLVDLGRLDEARTLLAPWLTTLDEEVTASRWYLERAEGHADAMRSAAADWGLVCSSPIRLLHHLVPLASR